MAHYARVNIHLSCIHKGLSAFLRVTPLIQKHDQTILAQCFDVSRWQKLWLPVVLNLSQQHGGKIA